MRSNENLHDELWDAIWREVSDGADPAIAAGFSPAVRAFLATGVVEGEVGNGGWEQLFYNQTDEWLDAAVEGWRLFGSDAHIELYREVRAAAAPGGRVRQEARDARTWEAFAETYKTASLGDYNRRWQDLAEDGERLRLEYVVDHPDEFVES